MLYIVVPVYNRVKDTLQILGSLSQQTYRDFQVIVVNDGSTDGTSAKVNQWFPTTKVLHTPGDYWWSATINEGVKYVMGVGDQESDYIMIINNDVDFAEDFLTRMTKSMGEKKDRILNPISLDNSGNGIVVSSGGRVVSWWLALHSHSYAGRNVSTLEEQEPSEADFLSGRGTLMPLSIFSKIGLYNQYRLPQVHSDYEFTWRAKRFGYEVLLDPTIRVYIDVQTTGLDPLVRRLTLREVLRSFWFRHSPSNLKARYNAARLMVPPYALPSYLLVAFMKIMVSSFVLNWLSKKKS
tara:strand:- start:453 stop:1337 length:885 start_codon:yes stop_codon:yes gene_type:complete